MQKAGRSRCSYGIKKGGVKQNGYVWLMAATYSPEDPFMRGNIANPSYELRTQTITAFGMGTLHTVLQ